MLFAPFAQLTHMLSEPSCDLPVWAVKKGARALEFTGAGQKQLAAAAPAR